MAVNYSQNLAFSGLGTVTVKVPNTDVYSVSGKIELPTISSGSSQSAVVVVVNKNGSPVYTGATSSRGFQTVVSCTAGDTLTIVLSSAATVDQSLNVIKSVMSIDQGEV